MTEAGHFRLFTNASILDFHVMLDNVEMKKRSLKKEEVVSAWEAIQQIPVDLRHTGIESALNIAIKYSIYAYDAYFLECADNLRSPLLTLDLGMQGIAREIGIPILE